jgi:hypothetical protein
MYSGMRMRTTAGTSGAVVAAVLLDGGKVTNCNYGTAVTHAHFKTPIAVTGLDHTHCILCWEQPGLQTRIVLGH